MKSHYLYTDAAGFVGFGATFEKNWFNDAWPEHMVHLPITFKELSPIVLPIEI